MKRILIIALSSIFGLLVIAFIGMLTTNIFPVGFGMHEPVSQLDGVALMGYDVVSYHDGNPQKGSEGHSTKYADATWHFISEENKALFESSPEKYMPAFGGHCSLAMSTGFAVEGEPESYEIIEGKLYIFSGDEVKAEFMKDVNASITACENNWDH